MKKIILFILLFVFMLLPFNQLALAHPGRTSSDGCHYCRTNCDSWGVPWNKRHCHGGTTTPIKTPTITSPLPPIIEPTKKELAYKSLSNDDKLKVLVSEIVDGDTIKIFHSIDYSNEKVRLIGIDTPETVDPRKTVQCFGKEAGVYLKSLIDNKTIELRKDDIGDNLDKYSRWLRYVYTLDDEDINLKMIKDGYAYAYLNYPFNAEKMKAYKEAENYARENKKGLWADDTCNGEREMKSLTTPTTTQSTIQTPIKQADEVKVNKSSNIFVNIKNAIKSFLKRLFK